MKHGRNDSCVCGSGEKFKKCCGSKRPEISTIPSLSDNHRWVNENVIKEGEILFYGILQNEIDNIQQENIWKEFRRVAEIYFGSGKNRIRVMQKLTDNTIEALIERDKRSGYAPPFCHKGCCNCCHELVYCTAEEAQCIIEYCRNNPIEIDNKKILRQLEYVEFDKEMNHTGITTWNDQEVDDQSCVFLNKVERSCTIWPVRPLVCRAHLAEDTSDYCTPYNGVENPKARGVNYIELSYILSVIFTIHQDSIKKTMGRLLLERSSI